MAARRKDFWELVNKTDECWLWTGKHTMAGYGVYRRRYAHRLSVEMHTGKVVPPTMQVDHACHVVECVNPAHLQVVTPRQNCENRSGANPRSSSGVRGVSWHRGANKWIVQVTSGGVPHYGGLFVDIVEAEAAAIELRNSLMTNNLMDQDYTR